MNFSRDIVDAADPAATALIELRRDGERVVWSFGEIADASARLAGTLQREGVGRGDVVMTLIGNRAEWVLAMVACFRLGAIALPCTEQLRPRDLRARIDATWPRLILADERNAEALRDAIALAAGSEAVAAGTAPEPAVAHRLTHPAPAPKVRLIPDAALFAGEPAAAVELDPGDGCLITFTSGTSGTAKPVLHGQRYLTGQALQAEHWLTAGPGDVVWCTAASGWSKSARNVFIAPWLRGATALLHDARFDPQERLAIVARERVSVLCMAPTEYRVIAKHAAIAPLPHARCLVAAGEALNPEVIRAFESATGLAIRDGYGQTETGQITAAPLGEPVRPGSMGRPLPGIRAWIDGGELVVDPATVPTFFLGYFAPGLRSPGADRADRAAGAEWRTGDRVHADADGFLFFEGRADDVIISAGYRIGPFEVESALVTHPAVADAAVVAAPDEERGAVVRAVVVLREGFVPSDALVRALQDHVKGQTAPNKYPRQIDFVAELPRTASGKVRRALLREQSIVS